MIPVEEQETLGPLRYAWHWLDYWATRSISRFLKLACGVVCGAVAFGSAERALQKTDIPFSALTLGDVGVLLLFGYLTIVLLCIGWKIAFSTRGSGSFESHLAEVVRNDIVIREAADTKRRFELKRSVDRYNKWKLWGLLNDSSWTRSHPWLALGYSVLFASIVLGILILLSAGR